MSMLKNFLEELESISEERQGEYGSPETTHQSIAALWSWYIFQRSGESVELEPMDVAAMMVLLKMVRVASPERNVCINETALDIAGYASIIYRLPNLGEETKPEKKERIKPHYETAPFDILEDDSSGSKS